MRLAPTATGIPARAQAMAVARPMPLLAPVMAMGRPVRSTGSGYGPASAAVQEPAQLVGPQEPRGGGVGEHAGGAEHNEGYQVLAPARGGGQKKLHPEDGSAHQG